VMVSQFALQKMAGGLKVERRSCARYRGTLHNISSIGIGGHTLQTANEVSMFVLGA
jgi:predicted NUDIX family phosphoesterase